MGVSEVEELSSEELEEDAQEVTLKARTVIANSVKIFFDKYFSDTGILSRKGPQGCIEGRGDFPFNRCRPANHDGCFWLSLL